MGVSAASAESGQSIDGRRSVEGVRAGGERGPLIAQGVNRDPPTIVDLAQTVAVGYADLVEKHLVEIGAAGHLTERPNVDPRHRHVDHERGESSMLRSLVVRSAQELSEVGVLGPRRPDLLAGDDPFVAVPVGECPE